MGQYPNLGAMSRGHPPGETDIVVESSTTGKYVARLLRDNGFNIHLANPKCTVDHIQIHEEDGQE
ncbi:MAG: hypothetical protein QXU18_00430 [Thermoplasmatales archaeon]